MTAPRQVRPDEGNFRNIVSGVRAAIDYINRRIEPRLTSGGEVTIESGSSAPSGDPGGVVLFVDTSASRLYVHTGGGTWKYVGLT